MRDLAAFEDALAAAIRGDDDALAPWLGRHPADGLSIYRNTVTKGAIDALAATYPTVVLMTGDVWFRAAAREFVAGHPPSEPSMMRYGERFSDWLSTFPPAGDTPYLAAMAQLDGLWWGAHFAADAPALETDAFATLGERDLDATGIRLHPAVRQAKFGHTLASLWLAHQADGMPANPADHRGAAPEYLLIARRGLADRDVAHRCGDA